MNKKIENIFIGGLPRSGTTLVQNLLNAHSQIYGGSEFDRIPNIIDLRNKLLKSLKQQRINEYTTPEEVDLAIYNLISDLIYPINLDSKITCISEKTPWNILFFEELLEIFPNAKFILVLRNPLDVYNSMKMVAKRSNSKGVSPPDFTTDIKLAVAYMEAVYRLGDSLSRKFPNRLLCIRYEVLITKLEDEARRIFSFLEQPWESNILNFHELMHPGEKTMTKDEIWYTKKQYNRKPKAQNTNSKKRNLGYLEEKFIQYRLRKNQFINPDYLYFGEPSIIGKIVGKLYSYNYYRNYYFLKTPKRVLD